MACRLLHFLQLVKKELIVALTQIAKDNAISNNNSSEDTAQKFTYLDCLKGTCAAPAAGMPGKLFFTLLMVTCMATCMCTFNGLRHHDWDAVLFFTTSHWMYPLVIPIALLVRLFIADKITGIIIPKYVKTHFTGIACTAVSTVVNVGCMCPIMTLVMTILLQGFTDLGAAYIEALPYSLPFAMCLNFFVVSPFVKIMHHNVISSTKGMHLMWLWARVMHPVTAFFN